MILRMVGSWFLFSLAFALGTWLGGWWAVPVLGGAWGWVVPPSIRRGPLAGAAAAGGWGILLGVQLFRGPSDAVAEVVGPILSLSGPQFFLLTVGFGGVLASAAAATSGSVRDAVYGRVAKPDSAR